MAMSDKSLYQAVDLLARQTHGIADQDLDQPYQWRAHGEGVRFALLGTYHELRDLAVRLADLRARSGPPRTRAQRALAQYHAAYRDLQAVLLGVTAEAYDQPPGPAEWPLRTILGHIVNTQRTFFALVHYGAERQGAGGEMPSHLPDGEVERLTGADDRLEEILEKEGLAGMLAFYESLHERTLREFSEIDDKTLDGPSLWWEGEEYDLQYRIHRMDAHLRQHTIQAEKTLAAIGCAPNEARRLLRLIFNALAEVEAVGLGAGEPGREQREELANAITTRAGEAATTVEKAQALIQAVQAGDLPRVRDLLSESPALAQARAVGGVSALLTAIYHGKQELAELIAAQMPELPIWDAAAAGRLDQVQEAFGEWPGWINRYASDGFTPLQLAAFFGHAEVVTWLVAHGADINAVARNPQRIMPLHAAAANGNLEIVQTLLDAGADVNAAQAGGFTPLHTAADSDSVPLARLLLDHGADPTLPSDAGQTPLVLAEEKGNHSVVEYLRGRSAGDAA
jgi:uncharacterized protein